jgi:hypothetical protein
MEKEMDVGIDEAGEQGDVAEVEDSCSLGTVDGFADGANAVAYYEDFAGAKNGACFDLEEPGAVEDHGGRCSLLGGSDDCGKEC